MTQKQIIEYSANSPFMQSLEQGSVEQLIDFRHRLKRHIRTRRRKAFLSFGQIAIISLGIGAVVAIASGARLPYSLIIYPVSILASGIYWLTRYGYQQRNARRAEKVISALVNSILLQKEREARG